MRAHRVRALLMGGQACVFYGAAEFSRDTDLPVKSSVLYAKVLPCYCYGMINSVECIDN